MLNNICYSSTSPAQELSMLTISIILSLLGLAYVGVGIFNPTVDGRPLVSDRMSAIIFGALLLFVGVGSIR